MLWARGDREENEREEARVIALIVLKGNNIFSGFVLKTNSHDST